ncbi:DUF202 domain-containing protein [bacterium]|nr:MAG: DUF202 domain-containing protein [bacterium]
MRNYISFKHYFENKDRIILRDYLALERTKLANERTLLSYVRASLYLILASITFLQLKGFESIEWLAYVILGVGFLLAFIGVWRYYRLQKRLFAYYEQASVNHEITE